MWFSITFTLHCLLFKDDFSCTELMLFASKIQVPARCFETIIWLDHQIFHASLTQKSLWFGLQHILFFPFPSLKNKIIIKNVFPCLAKLLIPKIKSIYKISLLLVLWRQVMQMTDLPLRRQNKISSLIICSQLACGYWNVQMETPFQVNSMNHCQGREEILLLFLPVGDTQPASLSCWLVDGSMIVFCPVFQVKVPTNFFPFHLEQSLELLNSKVCQKPGSLFHFLILKH